MAEITINAGVTKIDYPTAYALIESGKCILLDIYINHRNIPLSK